VTRTQGIITVQELTQVPAAKRMGLGQPDVSQLLNGQFRDVSVERLMRLLTRLGCDVDITIRNHGTRSVWLDTASLRSQVSNRIAAVSDGGVSRSVSRRRASFRCASFMFQHTMQAAARISSDAIVPLPQGRLQRCHVLQVASQIRRHGRVRRQTAEGAGRREFQAQEAAGGGRLGHSCSQGCPRHKAVAPQAKREAIVQMIEQFDRSERQACRLVGLSRDSFRNPPVTSQQTEALSAAILDIAQVRRRFGYRRFHDLLRPKFPDVNHKRVYRLYSVAKLAVRRRKRQSGQSTNGCHCRLPSASMRSGAWIS